jgi:hypothetical protein
MTSARTACLFVFACLLAAPAIAQNQIGGGPCSAATLKGAYALSLSGRGISASGGFAGSIQAVGTATFDGVSEVTFTGIVNTNQVTGTPFSYAGSYTLASNCYGPINFVSGDSTATYSLVVWAGGSAFEATGSDATYVYSASGNNTYPSACAPATLSGAYSFTASGFTLSGGAQSGSGEEAGVLQFDGQGNVTATSPPAISTLPAEQRRLRSPLQGLTRSHRPAWPPPRCSIVPARQTR